MSPQDSTMLSDIVEVGPLPCLTREGEEAQHCFYILTRQGLRYECSSASRIQVLSQHTSCFLDQYLMELFFISPIGDSWINKLNTYLWYLTFNHKKLKKNVLMSYMHASNSLCSYFQKKIKNSLCSWISEVDTMILPYSRTIIASLYDLCHTLFYQNQFQKVLLEPKLFKTMLE